MIFTLQDSSCKHSFHSGVDIDQVRLKRFRSWLIAFIGKVAYQRDSNPRDR